MYLISQTTNKSIEIGPYFTIGRGEEVQLQLQTPGVCERHARIEKKEGQFFIRDLRSREGTYVNHLRVYEAPLKEDDLIRIGEQEFLFANRLTLPTPFALSSKNRSWNEKLMQMSSVSKTDFPLLILGPSGSGKDVIARAVHAASNRNRGPYISVNCSALSESLVESELFGHVKGSFTGATNDRKGAFESARGGTLFLDEIGDLSYSLQAKLLRALENNEIRPVGSDKALITDVRIIAATHQNLIEKIRSGQFRSDLFYRLNVTHIETPALKDRLEDFESLVYEFAKKFRVRFSHEAIQCLKNYSWPGQIRELRNIVARASALFGKDSVEKDHVEELLRASIHFMPPQQLSFPDQLLSLQTFSGEGDDSLASLPVIKQLEKQIIMQRLSANLGNQRRTATDLGLPKSTLHDRIRTYNIDPEVFKRAPDR